jgi:LysM repeat protein
MIQPIVEGNGRMDYNHFMNRTQYVVFAAGVMLAILASGSVLLQDGGTAPTPYDVMAAVNAHRAANGYYALTPNTLVMAAAQTHAEWIVTTGQGGHIGASGSDETVRVSWTGYGGGAEIRCDENWASGRTVQDAMVGAWSDWTHQEVMLNAWGNRYTDMGAGVAAYGDGRYVFILNVCLVVGQEFDGSVPEANDALTPTDPLATADRSNYIYGVTLATPAADGSVTHTVLYGQTLAAIAKAYGVTIETLRTLNTIATDSTIIWVGEELVIQPAGSVPTYTQEAAPTEAAEATPSATTLIQTEAPQAIVSAPTQTPTPQAAPVYKEGTPIAGMVVLGLAGAALVFGVVFSSRKK